MSRKHVTGRWSVRLLLSALFLALLSGSALPARAGDGVWTPFGPPGSGGGLRVLAADPATPGTVYARAGFFDLVRSADGGRTWTWSGSGLQGSLPLAVVVDPAHPSTLYLTGSSGLFRSDDGARHWRLLRQTSGAGSTPLLDVLVASPAALFVTTANGLERSTDGGATWNQIFPGFPIVLQVSRTDPRRIYLLTTRGEIFQSADGGDSWAPTGPVVSGPPLERLTAGGLAVAPSDALTLYATNDRNFYRSTDGGAHWSRVSTQRADAVPYDTIVVDPRAKTHLYALAGRNGAAIDFSTDGGVTFRPVTAGVPGRFWAEGLVFDAAGRTAYAGSTPAVRLTGVRGDWTRGAPAGLPVGIVHFMKFSPADPATVYVGHDYGLSVSHDGGQTWSLLSGRGDLADLEFDPASPDVLFAAAGLNSAGVLRSADGGRTWTSLGLADLSPTSLLRRGGALLAGGNGILRSTDGGVSWSPGLDLSVFSVQRLIADPADPAVAYALIREARSSPQQPRLPPPPLRHARWRPHLAAARQRSRRLRRRPRPPIHAVRGPPGRPGAQEHGRRPHLAVADHSAGPRERPPGGPRDPWGTLRRHPREGRPAQRRRRPDLGGDRRRPEGALAPLDRAPDRRSDGAAPALRRALRQHPRLGRGRALRGAFQRDSVERLNPRRERSGTHGDLPAPGGFWSFPLGSGTSLSGIA